MKQTPAIGLGVMIGVLALATAAWAGVVCTFTGSAGTDLSTYSQSGEPTWTEHANYASGAIILDNANRARPNSGNISVYYSSDVPASADYSVEADLIWLSNVGSYYGLITRASTTASTFYQALYYQNEWRIYRVISGTATLLGAYPEVVTSGTHHLLFTARGINLTLAVDGTERVHVLDSNITTAGFGGLTSWGAALSDSTGIHFDNFQETDLATAGVGTNITITSPEAYQIIQRGSNNTASIPITGTYTGSPTAIEARWNNGAWTTIVASPAGGTFSGTLTGQTAGQGTLEVRHANNTANNASVSNVGVGEVFVVAGQSNAEGQGTYMQQWVNNGFVPGLFGNDNHWRLLADPFDSSYNQVDSVSNDTTLPAGSVWPLVGSYLMATTSVPVAFVPTPKGATAISAWQPSANHLDRSTLYGSMNYRASLLSAGARMVVWWQGETDATAGTTQSAYNSALDTLANAINSDRGLKLMAVRLQNSSGLTDANEDAIRAAVVEAANDNTNVLLGPDLSDLNTDDTLHLKSNANLATAGGRWAASILPYLPPVAPSGLIASTTSATTVALQWTDNSAYETGFTIDYSSSSAFASFATTTAAANATSTTVTGLSPATTYYFRVKGTNTAGASFNSASTSAVTSVAPDTTPPTPGSITFSGVTTTSITASSTGATDAGGLATTPFIYHATSTGFGSFSAATSTAVTFTGLTPNRIYYFEVGVQDAAGNWATSTVYSTSTLALTHTITATAGLHGSISPSGSVVVNDGDSQAFTITPDSGYSISQLTVDSNPVTTASSYTFSSVVADHTIAAAFAVIPDSTSTTTSPTHNASSGGGSRPKSAVVPSAALPAPVSLPSGPTHVFLPLLTPLALGQQSPSVTQLQQMLTEMGVYHGPITGYYGVLTKAAVGVFQDQAGIITTAETKGLAGPQTRAALNRWYLGALQQQLRTLQLQLTTLLASPPK